MATIIDAGLKYKDIISKSYKINDGSPKLYQMKPEKEDIGTLKRMTFGKKNPNKANRTILLVGETGAGKSSLINALVNFAMGVKWEDDVWFQLVEEEKKDQSQSQTSDVIVYDIFGLEDKTLPYSLTIIDTPGYGDTGGIERDEKVSQRLLDLFRSVNGVHEINAVGLVMKASENRLSDRLSYIFNSVVSLFGKDLEHNIVALMTHSDGFTPKDALGALDAAKVKCARNDKNQPVHFLFNNLQHRERNKDEEALEDAFNKAIKAMQKFTDLLQKTAPQKLQTTVQVLNERERLTACIQNQQERIEFMELTQKEIQQTQDYLKKCKEGMKNSEGFDVEVDEVYKEKDHIESAWYQVGLFKSRAVTCNTCEENCHFPGCTLAKNPSWCEVLKDGRCTSCTNKCPVADHVKEDKKWVTKTRKVKKTLEDLKKKYEEYIAQTGKTTNILESLQEKMKNLGANKTKSVYEAYDHVVRLEQIALTVVSVSTYAHLDFLIKEMEKEGDIEKVQKLREMSNRKDKGFIAAACYKAHSFISSK